MSYCVVLRWRDCQEYDLADRMMINSLLQYTVWARQRYITRSRSFATNGEVNLQFEHFIYTDISFATFTNKNTHTARIST